MISQRAEKNYWKGRKLFGAGRHRDALVFLRTAIEFDKEDNGKNGQGRYHSDYGLCLCAVRTNFVMALRHCRLATELEPTRGRMWWNLGRVAAALGRRGEAYRALCKARSLEPEHRGIVADLKRLGVRRQPVFSFLTRQHPLNVFLGKLRELPTTPIRGRRVRGRVHSPRATVAVGRQSQLSA